MPYCQMHRRLYVPTLGQWVPFSQAQRSGTRQELPVPEACCDLCIARAKTSMEHQFPHLYASVSPTRPSRVARR